jgi:hypothetical protein
MAAQLAASQEGLSSVSKQASPSLYSLSYPGPSSLETLRAREGSIK